MFKSKSNILIIDLQDRIPCHVLRGGLQFSHNNWPTHCAGDEIIRFKIKDEKEGVHYLVGVHLMASHRLIMNLLYISRSLKKEEGTVSTQVFQN